MSDDTRKKFRFDLYLIIIVLAIAMTIVTYVTHLDGSGDFLHKDIADRYTEVIKEDLAKEFDDYFVTDEELETRSQEDRLNMQKFIGELFDEKLEKLKKLE